MIELHQLGCILCAGCGKTALSNSLAPELVSLALPGNPYVSLKRINSDRLQK